jgi:folate-binding protein YgfZ
LRYTLLPERALVRLAGPEARTFLNALVSTDVLTVSAARAAYAALLTPQGKYLFDFFVIAEPGDEAGPLLLDCERRRRDELVRRLILYRLRAKVEIAALGDEIAVAAAFGDGAAGRAGLPAEPGRAKALGGGVVYVDPRLAELGLRAALPGATVPDTLAGAGFAAATPEDYDRHRLLLGVPDGSRDLEVDKSLLLESNFEALHGVDFAKGCYVGQELTARTKYRGLVKKRLYRVDLDGPLPPPDTPVLLDGREAGTVRSGRDGVALALLRLDQLAEAEASGRPLLAGETRLKPVIQPWMAP